MENEPAGAGAIGGAGAAAGQVPLQPPNPPNPPDPNPPILQHQPPVAAGGNPSGSQVNSIEKYDGEEGFKAETWCSIVDRAKTQYGWNDEQTAANAKQRLTGPALVWITAQEKVGPVHTQWLTLRPAIIKRFYPTVSDLAATDAVTELKLKPNETCGMFYDRVLLSVDKLFHRQPNRNAATMETFKAIVFSLFAAGLPPTMRTHALGSDKPPTTPEALLEAACAIEAQTRSRGQLIASVTPADTHNPSLEDENNHQNDPPSNVPPQVDEITQAVIAALKPKRFSGKCYYCDKEGHMARHCFRKQREEGGQAGRGRGRGRGCGRGKGRAFEVRDADTDDTPGQWTFTPYQTE